MDNQIDDLGTLEVFNEDVKEHMTNFTSGVIFKEITGK